MLSGDVRIRFLVTKLIIKHPTERQDFYDMDMRINKVLQDEGLNFGELERKADSQISRLCALELKNLDRLHDKLYSPLMDKVMVFITKTGNLGIIWFVAFCLMLLVDRKKTDIYTYVISLILCVIIGNIIIKNLVRRSRPFFHKEYKLLIKRPWDFSFPSGHTLSSFAAATVLFQINSTVGIVAIIYAVLIALSRLYLRVHFFTDVFFSMVLGVCLGIVAKWVYLTYLIDLL